jgi:hypothetical protein
MPALPAGHNAVLESIRPRKAAAAEEATLLEIRGGKCCGVGGGGRLQLAPFEVGGGVARLLGRESVGYLCKNSWLGVHPRHVKFARRVNLATPQKCAPHLNLTTTKPPSTIPPPRLVSRAGSSWRNEPLQSIKWSTGPASELI